MRPSAFLAVLVAVLAASPARADTVQLKNGDKITGTLVHVLDGKVVLKTDAAGEITIDVAQVESIATDQPVKVELPDGTRLHGQATAGEGGNVTVHDPAAGARTFALATAKLNEPEKPPRTWTGSLMASATWTRGNSTTNNVAVDANAVNRGEIDRITLDGWYRASRQKDQATGIESTTERRVGGSGKYDWFFAEHAYAYANALGERNEIAAIDLRAVAGVGAGWQFLESDTTHLNAEAGVSWFSEHYTSDTTTSDVDELAGRVAFHFDHTFGDVLSLFDDTEAFKVFDRHDDYLVKTKGGFRQKFNANFFAQQWVEFYWDSTPAAGKKREDVTYYVGVGWTF